MLIECQTEERPGMLVDFSFSMATVDLSESSQPSVLAKPERTRFGWRTEVLAIDVPLLLSDLNRKVLLVFIPWENLSMSML